MTRYSITDFIPIPTLLVHPAYEFFALENLEDVFRKYGNLPFEVADFANGGMVCMSVDYYRELLLWGLRER